jgi:cytochrome c oxidase accessory protein FixG
VVAYDYMRGEPRGKIRHEEEKKTGDCIDCLDCVRVCPTGIDIRNGTQLECVNCTACIDACDSIMTKVNRPTGLIRYASESNIAKGEKLKLTPRTIAYSVVLLVLLTVLSVLLFTRKDVQATVMRAQGMLFQEQPGGKISNLYNIKLVNKTRNDIPVVLKIEDNDDNHAEIKMVGKPLFVPKESVGDGVFFVIVDKTTFHERKNKIKLGVYNGDKRVDIIKTNFMAPNN